MPGSGVGPVGGVDGHPKRVGLRPELQVQALDLCSGL